VSSNISLPIVGHEDIYSSFKNCVRVQVFFCNRIKLGFFKSFGKEKREQVLCEGPANQWLWDAE